MCTGRSQGRRRASGAGAEEHRDHPRGARRHARRRGEGDGYVTDIKYLDEITPARLKAFPKEGRRARSSRWPARVPRAQGRDRGGRGRSMKIRAFRGYRYGIGRVADVSPVVAPPYDQISPEMQRQLEEMDPHNIVRLTLPLDMGAPQLRTPKPPPEGPGTNTRAPRRCSNAGSPRARGRARSGRRSTRITRPTRCGGAPITRMGFVALGEVTDYARGEVLPHERTHAGPKRDRLALLEATRRRHRAPLHAGRRSAAAAHAADQPRRARPPRRRAT